MEESSTVPDPCHSQNHRRTSFVNWQSEFANSVNIDDARKEPRLGDLEALLFAASPLSVAEIGRRPYLDGPGRPLQLRQAGTKWQIETRPGREDMVAGLRAGQGPLTDQVLEDKQC